MPAASQTINEDIKIVPSGENYGFGYSVAISGTTAIVGPLGHNSPESSGWVNLFDTETGQQLFRLTAHDAADQDNFGRSVAISGTTVIVGSLLDDDAGTDSGSAYLFDTQTGQELFKFTASDAAAGDKFGFSVGISGTTAIVASESGAYLFDTETGQQLFKLTDSDKAVAISGTTAIVGDRLFNTETGQQLFQLTPSVAGGGFGSTSVAISGTRAIVGAMYTDDPNNVDWHIRNAGAAYVFDTETGQQLFKLVAFDAASQDLFGRSVSISETTAIVGAEGNASAYSFDIVTGQKLYKLASSDGGHFFGASVAVSDTTAIVGAYRSGAAYLFFDAAIQCLGDLTGERVLNFLDVSAFLVAFGTRDPVADFTGDGDFNFLDVSAFLAAFGAGCP